MATGQTILTLAAIILLAIVSVSIRQMYVQSVHNSVDAQYTSDAVNFGRTLSERIQSYSSTPDMYNELDDDFGGFNDVTDPASRIEFTSPAGETLFATVDLSAEENVLYNQLGRRVTIRVFEARDGDDNPTLEGEYVTVVINLFDN